MDIYGDLRAVLDDDVSDTDWNLSEDDSETDEDDGNEATVEQLDPLDIAQAGEDSTTGPQGSGTGSVLGGEAAPLMNSDSDGLGTSVDAMELSSSPVMTATSPPDDLIESVSATTNGGLHPAYGDMVPQRDSTQSGDI